MSRTERVDAVVVGLGGMGASALWQLAATGRSVIGLEQFEPAHRRGSSHGVARIFRLAYRDSRYVALAKRALPLWRALESASGSTLLEQTGQIDHGHTGAIDEIAHHLTAAGLSAERLSPQAAAERWPGMRFGDDVLWSPDGGRCYAERTVDAALRVAAELGAEVSHHTPVVAISERGARGVVRTADREIEANVVVVAAGAWVAPLLTGVVSLPELSVTSDQPAHFAAVHAADEFPSFLHHSPETAGPAGLGFAAYGLTTPGLGVKVGGAGGGGPEDPDRRGPIDQGRVDRLVRYVEEWFPGLDPTPLDVTSCLFTSTTDEHFVLDRRGPFIVCSPCSGHGFKFVPAIGKAVADLADGASPEPLWSLPG